MEWNRKTIVSKIQNNIIEMKWPFVYYYFFFHRKIHNIPASFKRLAFSILWQTWMSDTDEMPQSCQRMISQIGNVWQVLAISWIFVGHTELCNNSSLIWQQQRASSFTLCPFSFNNSTIWLGLHLVLMSDCGYVLHNQIEVFFVGQLDSKGWPMSLTLIFWKISTQIYF